MVFGFRKKSDSTQNTVVEQEQETPLDQAQSTSSSLLPVFACGAGLFSDGYINNVIGSVSTVLAAEYADPYTKSSAINNVSDFLIITCFFFLFFFWSFMGFLFAFPFLGCLSLMNRNIELNMNSRSQLLPSPAPWWASSSSDTWQTTGAESTLCSSRPSS